MEEITEQINQQSPEIVKIILHTKLEALGDDVVQKKVADFAERLLKTHSIDELRRSELYNILLYSTPPAGMALDFHDADNEIKRFVIEEL